MRYWVLAFLLAAALPGCAENSFGAPQWRNNVEAPAWRRPGSALPPLQHIPAPAYSARA